MYELDEITQIEDDNEIFRDVFSSDDAEDVWEWCCEGDGEIRL